MDGQAYVYIMASARNGTIYIGSTTDLPRRTWEHRNNVIEGFTKRHGCKLLVWYEAHGDLESARVRELRMKDWKRAWKLREIEGLNPDGRIFTTGSRNHERHRYWTPAFAGEGIYIAGAWRLPRAGNHSVSGRFDMLGG